MRDNESVIPYPHRDARHFDAIMIFLRHHRTDARHFDTIIFFSSLSSHGRQAWRPYCNPHCKFAAGVFDWR